MAPIFGLLFDAFDGLLLQRPKACSIELNNRKGI